jgi:hypothetical protein
MWKQRQEGNREYTKNEDEDDYEEGGSYEGEQGENDTDEESTQEAAHTTCWTGFLLVCPRQVEWGQEATLEYFKWCANKVLKDRRKVFEIFDELKQLIEPSEFLQTPIRSRKPWQLRMLLVYLLTIARLANLAVVRLSLSVGETLFASLTIAVIAWNKWWWLTA